jgi:hypothetical protein
MFERIPTQWFFESVEMLFGYVRQELVDPLRNAVRWVGFGLLGGLLMLIGLVFVAVGSLRLLQSSLLPFDGAWSWVPYLAVSLVGVVGVALTFSRISRRSLN